MENSLWCGSRCTPAHSQGTTRPRRALPPRSADGGLTWDQYRVEVSPGEGDLSIYNPSLVLLPNGDLLFFYLTYHHLVWNEPLQASGRIKRSKRWGSHVVRPNGAVGPRTLQLCQPHTLPCYQMGDCSKAVSLYCLGELSGVHFEFGVLCQRR